MRALQLTGATTAYVSLLRVTSESGELKSLAVADGIASHKFRVTIDGKVVVAACLASTASGGIRSNNGLAVGLRFEQSLLVEVSASAPSPQTTYWAVACTDSSELVRRVTYAEDVGEARYLFERLTYRREDNTDYDVTLAVGPDRISRVVIDNESLALGDAIAGSVELRNAEGEHIFEESVPLIIRLNGTRRKRPILDENGEPFILRNVDGSARFEIPEDWWVRMAYPVNRRFFEQGLLPAPYLALFGPYVEIATDLPGFANYPAELEIW